jgi:hypothetical protein
MRGVVNKAAILPRSFKAGEEWQLERSGSGEFCVTPETQGFSPGLRSLVSPEKLCYL